MLWQEIQTMFLVSSISLGNKKIQNKNPKQILFKLKQSALCSVMLAKSSRENVFTVHKIEKRVFLSSYCHEIYRVEVVGIENSIYT